jgi:hypothetical protein
LSIFPAAHLFHALSPAAENTAIRPDHSLYSQKIPFLFYKALDDFSSE